MSSSCYGIKAEVGQVSVVAVQGVDAGVCLCGIGAGGTVFVGVVSTTNYRTDRR